MNRPELRLTLLLLLCGGLGCTTQSVWFQDGKSPSDRDRDMRECQQQAASFGYTMNPNEPGESTIASRGFEPVQKPKPLLQENPQQQRDKFRACMEEKGYRLTPQGDVQASP